MSDKREKIQKLLDQSTALSPLSTPYNPYLSPRHSGAFFQATEEREPSAAGEFGSNPDFVFEISERKRSNV